MLDELIQSSLAGRIATDGPVFNRYVVMLPLAVVCLVNIGVAILQVTLSAGIISIPSGGPDSIAPTRRLRGSQPLERAFEFPVPDDIKVYLQPVLVQILLVALQVAAAFVLSRGPQICRIVNSSVGRLERTLNERINGRISTAVDRVFGQAFSEVKDKVDTFF